MDQFRSGKVGKAKRADLSASLFCGETVGTALRAFANPTIYTPISHSSSLPGRWLLFIRLCHIGLPLPYDFALSRKRPHLRRSSRFKDIDLAKPGAYGRYVTQILFFLCDRHSIENVNVAVIRGDAIPSLIDEPRM